MGERLFTFTVDWRDPHAGVARSFLLLYHPDSSEVELVRAAYVCIHSLESIERAAIT